MKNNQYLKQRLYRLFEHPDFIKVVNGFRKKWGIPDLGFRPGSKEYIKWRKELVGKTKNSTKDFWKMNDNVLTIVKDFQLSESLYSSIRNYLINGEMCEIDIPTGCTINYIKDEITGKWHPAIVVDENTRLVDVKNAYAQIIDWHPKIKGKNKSQRQSDPMRLQRDAEIFRMYFEKVPIKEIIEEISDKYPDDKYQLTNDDFRKIIQEKKREFK